MKLSDLSRQIEQITAANDIEGNIEIKVCVADKNGNPHTGYAHKCDVEYKPIKDKKTNFCITIFAYEGGK